MARRERTGIIDRLEAGGFIIRRPDRKGDRRVDRVVLTPQGRAIRQPLDAAMDALDGEIATEFGSREAAALWRALRRLGRVNA